MYNQEVQNIIRECWAEIREIKKQLSGPVRYAQASSFLTKYALIRCCGTLEVSFKTILAKYAGYKLCTRTENYIDYSLIGSSDNPRLDVICKTLKSFDRQWSRQFDEKIENLPHPNQTKAAIKSLVRLRNAFAHGKNSNVTFIDIKNYFVEANRVIKIMDSVVGQKQDDAEEVLIRDTLNNHLRERLVVLLSNIAKVKRVQPT